MWTNIHAGCRVAAWDKLLRPSGGQSILMPTGPEHDKRNPLTGPPFHSFPTSGGYDFATAHLKNRDNHPMSTAVTFAQDLKQQTDIVRIIGDYIQLKKAGAQNFTGLCPFHKEKSPSFSVHATRQFFHCFGCGEKGDVFTFVQKIESVTFPEAVRRVAEKMGVPVPRQSYSGPGEALDAKQRGVLLDLHEKACAFFEEQLRRPEGARAREYLAGRGLSEATLREFRIGFAPDSGFLLKDRLRGMTDEETLKASGLFSWKQDEVNSNTRPGAAGSTLVAGSTPAAALYSKFRNRVMFPICNEQGKVIAFTGRTLATDEKSGPKYLNSPETPIYSKGRVLFNLHKAKEAIRVLKYAILVEGNVDSITVFESGFHNVIATSGTAFSEAQVRLLGRFTKQVVVNFDPDTAGAAATERSLAMLVEEDFKIKVLTLEPGFDPDLYIRRKGVKAYREALTESPDYFAYLISRAASMFPVKTPDGKAKALNYLLPYIKQAANSILRDELASNAAQKLGIDSAVLRQEFRRAAVARSPELRKVSQVALTEAERVLIRALIPNASVEPDVGLHACTELKLQGLHENSHIEHLINSLLENFERLSTDISEMEFLSPEESQFLSSVLAKETSPITDEDVASALKAFKVSRLETELQNLKIEIVRAVETHDIVVAIQLRQRENELRSELTQLDTLYARN